MIKDIKIKDTQLVLKLKAQDKLPISDGSGNPKGVSIDQIKQYVQHNIDILTSPKVDNNILKFTNGKGEEISVNLPDYQTYVNEQLNAFNQGVRGQISGAVQGCNLYTDSAKSNLESQIATKFDLCVQASKDNSITGVNTFTNTTKFLNMVFFNGPASFSQPVLIKKETEEFISVGAVTPESILVQRTQGETITNSVLLYDRVQSPKFIKTNGTSDELLVADGSVINKSEFLTSVPAATSDSIGGAKQITIQPISETATLEEVVTAYNALIEALKNAGINNI